MTQRRSIKGPVAIGVTMIVLLVALLVGWVILSVREALANTSFSGLYWTLLLVGTIFLAIVIVGVVFYLGLSIKAINLNRRQSNFIDSVTHELKSPIASLKLYLQTLNRHSVSEKERADFHRFMLEDVERLDELINHLLDVARLDQETIPNAPDEDVELDQLLVRCARDVCQRHGVSRDVVKLSVQPTLVRANPFELELVFRNLIDNAVKYAADSPQVIVKSWCTPPHHVITQVADNGRGIPSKERRQIFSRFVRVGDELERDTPGTGLGLHIVRTLIERLRGRIHVRDRETDQGTVFEVQLRGRAREESPSPSPETQPVVSG